jgi:hypothetical protein
MQARRIAFGQFQKPAFYLCPDIYGKPLKISLGL